MLATLQMPLYNLLQLVNQPCAFFNALSLKLQPCDLRSTPNVRYDRLALQLYNFSDVLTTVTINGRLALLRHPHTITNNATSELSRLSLFTTLPTIFVHFLSSRQLIF